MAESGLRLLPAPPDEEWDGPSPEVRFAWGVASALLDAPAPVTDGCPLTVKLITSSALAFTDLDLDRACEVVMSLRRAIVSGWSGDTLCEPVPLMVRDRRLALINLLDYLGRLVERASGGGPAAARAEVLGRALTALAC